MLSQRVVGLSLFSLILLITSAIDSIRNLPATALFGSALIFFFIFSAIVFLIPVSLISAELSSAWTEQGGVYYWSKLAFGENWGFLTIWLQWINTLVWFPTILSFVAGTAVYFLSPDLAQNKIYLVSVILGVFWLLTLLNLKGIEVSARFNNFCTLIGLVIPMALIIILAMIWVFSGKPVQIHFTAGTLFPSLHHSENWISLTAIMAAFLGMELATVHVRDIHNPQRNFPKALFYSVVFILFTMIMGALAIALVIPSRQINLVNGVIEAFGNFFKVYHLDWLMPIITLMMILGSLGGMISWIISPARGLLQAAQSGFLPSGLQKINKHGVAAKLLILQAVIVSLVCLAFLLMPSVNGSYWLLTDLSTQLYMLMYVLMFIAALRLKHKFPAQNRPFQIPGGKLGMWVVSLLGLVGCIITLVIGFFPPDNIAVGGFWHYELIFSLGIIVMILPVGLFYAYRYKQLKAL